MDTVSLLLDIITVLLFVTPVIVGIKKGLKNRVLTIICFIVSAAAASAISNVTASKVYDNCLHDSVLAQCEKIVKNNNPVYKADDILKSYGIDVEDEQIQEALTSAESIPESVGNLAENHGLDSETLSELKGEISETIESQVPEQLSEILPGELNNLANTDYSSGQLYDAVRACASSAEEGAEYIESRYAAPMFTAVLKAVIFAVAVCIVGFIVRLVFRLFGFDFRDDAQTATDMVLGGIFGLISGLVNVVAYVVIISFCEQTTQGLFDISQTNSVVFKVFYDFLY